MRFDENGDPIASYDLMNWQQGQDGSLQLTKVGYYDDSLGSGKDLVINRSALRGHEGFQVRQLPAVSKHFTLQILVVYCYLLLGNAKAVYFSF